MTMRRPTQVVSYPAWVGRERPAAEVYLYRFGRDRAAYEAGRRADHTLDDDRRAFWLRVRDEITAQLDREAKDRVLADLAFGGKYR